MILLIFRGFVVFRFRFGNTNSYSLFLAFYFFVTFADMELALAPFVHDATYFLFGLIAVFLFGLVLLWHNYATGFLP